MDRKGKSSVYHTQKHLEITEDHQICTKLNAASSIQTSSLPYCIEQEPGEQQRSPLEESNHSTAVWTRSCRFTGMTLLATRTCGREPTSYLQKKSQKKKMVVNWKHFVKANQQHCRQALSWNQQGSRKRSRQKNT